MVTGHDGIFTFTVRCWAQQVYLMLGGRRMLAMRPVESDEWQLRLRLQEGTHKFRYYVDDGHSIERFVPEEAQFSSVRERDAVLVVDEVTSHAEERGAMVRL